MRVAAPIPFGAFVLYACVLSACAGRTAPASAGVPERAPASTACVLLSPPTKMRDSLRIAVTGDVDPVDAPLARTSAEHVVFPLLYSSTTPVPCPDGPAAALQVAAPATRSSWPAGPGPYHVDTDADTVLRLIPQSAGVAPILRVTRVAVSAARDALDAGVDLLITSDPTTLRYADGQAGLASVPLPWDRLYVLIIPGRATSQLPAEDSALALRTDLATGAVRVDAEPAPIGAWWRLVMTCPALFPPVVAAPSLRGATVRIAYDRRDAVARALAERLVALANARMHTLTSVFPEFGAGGTVTSATGDSSQSAALPRDSDRAYVVELPVYAQDPCRTAETLESAAPWLVTKNVAVDAQVVPLIMTRARAIVREGVVGLAADSLGSVYLLPRPRPAS